MAVDPKKPRERGREKSPRRVEVEGLLKAGASRNAIIGMGYPKWLVNRAIRDRLPGKDKE